MTIKEAWERRAFTEDMVPVLRDRYGCAVLWIAERGGRLHLADAADIGAPLDGFEDVDEMARQWMEALGDEIGDGGEDSPEWCRL